MSKYKLDFTTLTIRDMLPVLSGAPTTADVLVLADKVIIGGIMHLSPTEIKPITELVSQEIAAWLASDEFMKMVKKE